MITTPGPCYMSQATATERNNQLSPHVVTRIQNPLHCEEPH
jgi:hypothetical protein